MRLARTTPRSLGLARAAVLAPLAAVLLLGRAEAQEPTTRREARAAGSSGMRVIETSRRSGPPGTEVTLRPLFLPSVTPVQISIGGTRSGFEVLAQMMTDLQGELTESVTFKVPSWAERDRTYMFFVLDLYFRPLAASEAFYVTDEDGTLLRRGRITQVGAQCITLRGEGDDVYSLTGVDERLQAGDSVAVEGVVVDGSACGDDPTIEVRRVQWLNRAPSSAAGSPGGDPDALASSSPRATVRTSPAHPVPSGGSAPTGHDSVAHPRPRPGLPGELGPSSSTEPKS